MEETQEISKKKRCGNPKRTHEYRSSLNSYESEEEKADTTQEMEDLFNLCENN